MDKLLRELGPAIAGRVARNATKAGAQVVAEEAKRLVPVDTGELGASITVISAGERESDTNPSLLVESRVGFFKPTSRRAHLTEFGTAHSAAKPFLRPAMDSRGKDALNQMGVVLTKGIAREARKLAKP